MAMTTDAKQALKETVRSLRGRLLADLHDATESQWQLGVRMQNADLDEATRATFEAWAAEQVRTQAAPVAPKRAKRATRAKQARGRSAAPDAAVDEGEPERAWGAAPGWQDRSRRRHPEKASP
jgi:hypothetical protein